MMKQTIQPINNIQGNSEFKYENIDFLDVMESKRCTVKIGQQFKFHIGCPNCGLSIVKNLKYYLTNKLENLKHQTSDCNTQFKNSCFNCSSSFYGSRHEHGDFNVQKIVEVGNKCDSYHKNYRREELFYDNRNGTGKFKNVQVHRFRKHNSKLPYQRPAFQLTLTDGAPQNYELFKNAKPKNNIQENSGFEFENIDSLDLIESPMDRDFPQFEYRDLHHINNLKYYFKHKLEDMKLQTVYYKSHFKKPCFYCSYSFHCSKFKDGYLNLQKIFEFGKKCITCQTNCTTERTFHHNCKTCNASFENCDLLAHHRRRVHNSKKPYQCAVCHLSSSHESTLSRHICKHKLPNICPYCKKECDTKTILKVHMLSHTGRKLFSYKKCLKQYRAKKNLNIHVKHTGGKRFKCEVCAKTFAKISLLNQHKLVHMEKPFQCKYCSKKYTTKFNLDVHLLKHIFDKQFKCDVCDKTFAEQHLFNEHKTIQIGEVLQCKYCPKQYVTKCEFDAHSYEEHTGGKQVKCDICDKTFDEQFKLNRHKLIHMKKSFQCKYCFKNYTSQQYLSVHLIEHIDGKQFKCDECDKNFVTQHMLNRHKTIHLEQLLQCKYCPKQYKTKRALDLHLYEHINKQLKYDIYDNTLGKQYKTDQHEAINILFKKSYQCKYCPENYETKQYLDTHMLQHIDDTKFQCDLCDKTFAKQNLLNRHKLIHTEESFQCKYCARQYKAQISRDIHEEGHNTDKKLSCSFCDKTFTKKYLFDRHKYIHMEQTWT